MVDVLVDDIVSADKGNPIPEGTSVTIIPIPRSVKFACYNVDDHESGQKVVQDEGGNCHQCGGALSKQEGRILF